ncbi:DMT family transporter [Streptomyces buecherae]|uniref:DMT family transporter n=1 Tax=Streptomyces buecherae TaxID=2763006 RepID=UPI00364C7DDE
MAMKASRAYTVGLPAALAATALWGFTFLGPAAVEPVNIYYLVLGRYVVFGLLSLTVLLLRRGSLRSLGRRRLLVAMRLGVVGYIGFYLLLAMSAELGGGVLASTMTGLIPLMVTLVSNRLEKVLAWRRLAAPIVVISLGLLLVNAGTPTDGASSSSDLALGALLGFLSAAAWSYFVIANRRALGRVGANIDGTTWTTGIGLGACCGSLFLLPLALAGGGRAPVADAGTWWSFVGWSVAFAVLGSWCATWFWNSASKRLPATVMGPVIGMEAVCGAAFNLLWEGRTPTFHELWGGLLVITGVLLASYLFNRADLGRGNPPSPGAGEPPVTAERVAGTLPEKPPSAG